MMFKQAKGSHLLDLVFAHLELNEREYFGLTFNDTGNFSSVNSPDHMRWLDPAKPVRKQMSRAFSFTSGSVGSGSGSKLSLNGSVSSQQPTLYFRVKFYVTDPSRLQEEYTRYHVYLQVRKDLIDGRLPAPSSTLCLLTSYAVQSTVGDFDPDTCRRGNNGYLIAFRELAALCSSSIAEDEFERRVIELHKLHRGQSPAESEFNFLEHAKRLEMYGISLHQGKDSGGKDIQLGVTSIGLVVFQNQLKINTFSWSKIVKISFKRKQFFIQLRKELTETYDTLLGFNLASYRSCKNLWKSAVEHHSFFRLHSPKPPQRRFLLNLGSKFRYSGRTEFQTATNASSTCREEANSKAKPLGRMTHSRKTLPLSLETRASGESIHVTVMIS